MRGLGRNADGLWTWNNNPNMTEVSIPAFSPSNGGPPLLSEAVEAITNLTPAHNTIEVKREHLELSRISLASLHANGVSEVGTSTPSNALITNTMDNINPQPEQLMDSVNPTHQPPSQTAGKKRLRDETANTSEQQPKRPRVKHARKSLGHSAWLKLQRERELQEKLAASESSQLSSEEDKANTKISTSPKNEKKVHALTLKLKRSAPSVVLPPTQRQNLLRRSSPTSLSASTASPSKDKLRILERSPTALKSISAPIAVANPQTATQGLSGATAPLHSFDSQSKIPTTPSTSSSTAISSTVTSVSQPITQDASRPSNLVLQSPVTPLLPEPATSISIISQLHSGAAMNNPSDHDTSLPNTNVDAKTGPVLPPSTPETSSIMDTTMTHLPTPVLTLGTSASPTATIALKPPKTPVPQSDLVESSSSSQTSTNESAEPQTPSQNAKLAMSVSTSLPSSELQSGPKTPPSPQTPASHVTDIVIASKETARRPVVFSRSSESVIARGLLEIAHLSSAVHDTVEVEPEKIVEDRPMANGDGSVPDASVSKVAPVQEEKAMAMSGPPPSLKGPRATATSDMAMLDAGAQCLSADASSATQVSDGVASLDKIAKGLATPRIHR
ncbi:hypothetical protein BDZ97DRAFT_8532 [Flammula alnicola]|nr:hypothetical protein BDZ97DRAFT_8532 [Flammula alnicola]